MLGPCNSLRTLAWSRWTKRTRDFWQILLAARGARVEHGSGGVLKAPKMILSIFIFYLDHLDNLDNRRKTTPSLGQGKSLKPGPPGRPGPARYFRRHSPALASIGLLELIPASNPFEDAEAYCAQIR